MPLERVQVRMQAQEVLPAPTPDSLAAWGAALQSSAPVDAPGTEAAPTVAHAPHAGGRNALLPAAPGLPVGLALHAVRML